MEEQQKINTEVGEEQIEEIIIDYSSYSKEELLEQLKGIQRTGNLLDEEDDISKINQNYKAHFNEEKNEAFEAFLNEGGKKEDFEYRIKDTDKEFFDLMPQIEKRIKQLKNEEKENRLQNTQKKNWVLDQLRELVQNGEIKGENFSIVKDLQEQWRNAEPVFPKDKSELWSNYRALLNIFYTNHSILNDLRDLDRKKNLEEKEKLTAAAEELLNIEIIKNALAQYRDLADKFWSTGPVPEENKEAIITRFKAVRDELDKKFKVVQAQYKEKMAENFIAKQKLVEQIESFPNFVSDRINEWKDKTKEIKALQDQWKQTSPVDREQVKPLSKTFWEFNKQFFAKKSEFFDGLEKEREANLEAKSQLIEKVKQLQEDANKALSDKIEIVKRIQADWKKIGPAPREMNDSIFDEFRAICNSFFDERKEIKKEEEKSYVGNFEQKLEICAQLKEETDLGNVEDLMNKYSELGFVPKEKISEIKAAFNEAVENVLSSIEDKESDNYFKIKLLSEFAGNASSEKLFREAKQKKSALKNKLSKLNKEKETLTLNMERFSSFGGSNVFQEEGENKIKILDEEINSLKKRLRLIDQISE